MSDATPLGTPPSAGVDTSRPHGTALTIGVVAIIVLLDQAAKALVRAGLPLHDSVNVIPGLLAITHVRNTGAVFGILNATDFPYKSAVMLTVAIVAFLAIAYYATLLPEGDRTARLGLAFVLGGAVGNLIDRAVTGYVTDFVDLYWGNWHFWAFNVADAAITIGASLIVLDLVGAQRRASNPV
jgi:signal peptidase II